MVNQLKWGIIGVGDVTEVKSGPAFRRVPHSDLVAVMRRDSAKAEDYAERHGVPRWYANARQLINDPEVNAVYVATPPDSHAYYAKEILRAGKPVYLEKPMTRNLTEAREILDVLQETGGKLCVAHYRREQPYFKKVKELIAERIGTPRVVNLRFYRSPLCAEALGAAGMQWRLDPTQSGGGLFHDIAPHQLDLIRYFFGKVGHISGVADNQAKSYGPPDMVTGQVLFESGVAFTGQWAFNVSEETDIIEVMGTAGQISFSAFDRRPIVVIDKNGTQQYSFEPLVHVQEPMIAAVAAYFRGEGHNPCSAAEGYEVMEMLERLSVAR